MRCIKFGDSQQLLSVWNINLCMGLPVHNMILIWVNKTKTTKVMNQIIQLVYVDCFGNNSSTIENECCCPLMIDISCKNFTHNISRMHYGLPNLDHVWAPCQMRKIAGCACAGNAGNVFPAPQIRDPDMHHGTCVTHVPWCMLESLNCVFLWSWWRGKRSRHSRRMRNPQFYVSDKRPLHWVYKWITCGNTKMNDEDSQSY